MSSSRFPHGSDSRYPPRDRSPPPSRFDQRRGSAPLGPPPQNRDGGATRPNDPHSFSAPPRDAPRAPKADKDSIGRAGFGSRGRSNFSRGSERDSRDQFRRGDNDWGSGSADGGSSHGRTRSRSPPARGFRDSKERQDRNGAPPSSATSAASDGGFSRDGVRGRSRGEMDQPRNRGGLMPDDREPFKARSHSQNRWRDAPGRPESRNSGGSQTSPSTPLVASAANPLVSDRFRDKTTPSSDTSRRRSFASSHDPRPDIRADLKADAPGALSLSPTSPQSAAASLPHVARQASNPPGRDDTRVNVPDPTLVAPKAPKAELHIPTGPRASAMYAKRAAPAVSGHRHDLHDATQSPSAQRYGGRPVGVGPGFSAPSQPRSFGQRTSPTFARPPSQDGSADGSAGHLNKPIPTGPRAQQASIRAPMARPSEPAAMRRNTIPPKQPSIMKPMIPSKRDSVGDERPGPERRDSAGSAGEPRRASATILGNRDHGPSLGRRSSDKMEIDAAPTDEGAESLGGAEESEEDNLDEEDFEEAERIFLKDMENLKAKRPPSPGHHPELMILLEDLNALEAAADDLRNGVPPPPLTPEERPTRLPLGLPSPSSERVDAAKEDEDVAHMDQASVSEELPTDGLPFLASGPPTPVSQISFKGEYENGFDVPKGVIEAVMREKADEEAEWSRTREFYAIQYKAWRLNQEALDMLKHQEEKLKKASTPQPSTEEPQQATTGRRRDRSAYSTQADEQDAIEASKASYEKEQREREERENLDVVPKEDLPDYAREVVIPDLLFKSEHRADIFEDVNHLIETNHVLRAYFFVPQPDDFTEEEQEKFIDAYVATPKKWGHIARELPGREYQDCIRHYYLTKKETQYKIIAERRRTKRGRKRVAGGRPKANALLPDRADPPGPEELTDAGRPKRAAAPAFFGEPKRDLSDSSKTTPGRKTANAAKGDADGSEKPTGRGGRGSRGGAARREGAGRGRGAKAAANATPATAAEGSKAPALTAAAPLLAPSPSPQKPGAEARRSKSTERRNEEQRSRDLEVAQSLANLQGTLAPPGAPSLTMAQAGQPDNWRADPRSSMATAPPEMRGPSQAPHPGGQVTDINIQGEKPATAPRSGTQGRGPGQVTSYWSVAENEAFGALLQFYGTDWGAIASVLGTKSHTMCKNNYQRQISNGKEPSWEKIADEANERIRREGHPTGPPPVTPLTQQRRRVDPVSQQNAAQSAAQRTLAPNSETADIEKETAAAAAAAAPNQASPPVYTANRQNLVQLRQAGSPRQTAAIPQEVPFAQARSIQDQQSPPRGPQVRVPSGGYTATEQRMVHPQAMSNINPAHDAMDPEHRSTQAMNQERFTTLMSAQHAQAHDSQRLGPLGQREPIEHGQPIQYAPGRQPVPPQQPPSILQPSAAMQGRTSIAELERGARATQLQPKLESVAPELRREPSYDRYRQPAQPSPMVRSGTNDTPPRLDSVRPGSTSQHVPAAPAPPAEKKRSNIMMMLNDDPPEPSQPKPQPPQDTRPMGPGGGHSSPANPMAMYQHPSQQPAYQRRDPIIDAPSRHHEQPPPPSRHGYPEPGYGGSMQMQQPSSLPPQPERREPPGWAGSVQRAYYEQPRPTYQSAPSAASPQPQHSYLPQSRASISQPRIESPPPPPAHHSHSRASSYTGAHQHGGQPQHTLAPHPYASIAPPSSSQSHPHAPPPQPAQAAQHIPQSPYQRHVPPPPYSGQQQQQAGPPMQPMQGVPPPRPASSFGLQSLDRGHPDMMRREEEMRRYGSPALRQSYGYPPPPPPPSAQDRPYDRRYDERR